MPTLADQGLTSAERPAGVERDRPARRLGLHHFAFVRSYFEGLPFDQIAKRYLETGTNLPAAKATLRWAIDELAAAARRVRPAVARLLKIAPARLNPPADTPTAPAMTLEDFQAERDPEGFYTERELIELFEAEIAAGLSPALRRQATRNARLRERQLEAIRWLEGWIAETPKATDPVLAWLDPAIAERLTAAGLETISDLVARINTRGQRWWSKVPKVGPQCAARLLTWLDMNRVHIGTGVEATALVPYAARVPALKAARAQEFGIVPLEHLAVPEDLSGVTGLNRGFDGTLAARTDLAAMDAWLASRKNKPHTHRSYRMHVERFYLWALNERGKALSSLTTEDCIEYRDFLDALGEDSPAEWRWGTPRSAWVGKHHAPRWSPEWRPFAGALAVDSQNLACRVCYSLCEWLTEKLYLRANPWKGVEVRSTGTGRLQVERSLTVDQWRAVLAHVSAMPREEPYFRLWFVLWLAVTGGMRLSELAAARLGAIQPGALDPERGQTWEIVVIGKRDRRREVPLPAVVMEALADYLRTRGVDTTYPNWPADEPLIVTLGRPYQRIAPVHQPVSDDAIYGMLTRLFRDVAKKLEKTDWVDADRLRKSSTHWLRHTFAARSIDEGADLRHVMSVLGHKSLNTTSQYVIAERRERSRAVARFAESLMAATLPLPLED